MAQPVSEILDAGLRTLGLQLPADASERMLRYLDELQKWNSAYNLTAIRDPREMVTKHLLDSLTILPLVKGYVLDVGSGAGLPAFPLAICNPALRVTALDSNGKKARFMRHTQRNLGVENIEVVESRVENLQSQYYDVVTSRAFSSLNDFFDKTSHLLAPGGVWVAMKGKLDGPERDTVPAHIEIREIRRLQVPGLNEERHAVIAAPKKT